MIPLGRILRSLSETLQNDIDAPEDASPADIAIDAFLEANERYANALRLASLSSAHALKAWAAERLPGLKISYGFTNRIDQQSVQSNLDEQAPLRLVEFADDLTMIARFCRDIEELTIEAAPHSHGLEFRFTFKSTPLDDRFAQLEEKSIQQLLHEGAKDHCLKNRIIATGSKLEAQSIVLRKRVRLGFSPMR